MQTTLDFKAFLKSPRLIAILIVVVSLLITSMSLRKGQPVHSQLAPGFHAAGAEQQQQTLNLQFVHNSLQSPDPPSKKSIKASGNAAEAAAQAAAKIAGGN
jgi:hypothetical protein